jgi:type II secretory pathway component PulK
MTQHGTHNNRGVALLIVLLVTALLIALIFEFAYGTRVSLRAAVNFRDSQRAYFLARSGVNFVGRVLADNLKKGMLQNNLEQKDWQVVPIVSGGDTELRVRWEDESGKIPIASVVQNNDAYKRLEQLFDIREINQDVLKSRMTEKKDFRLLTELHQVMSDEDFGRVRDFLTVFPLQKIDINTASVEVLQSLCRSLGKDDGPAIAVVSRRAREPFMKIGDVVNFPGMDPLVASYLDVTGNVFKVSSSVTVNGYTKYVEAVIERTATGFTLRYWRAL